MAWLLVTKQNKVSIPRENIILKINYYIKIHLLFEGKSENKWILKSFKFIESWHY